MAANTELWKKKKAANDAAKKNQRKKEVAANTAAAPEVDQSSWKYSIPQNTAVYGTLKNTASVEDNKYTPNVWMGSQRSRLGMYEKHLNNAREYAQTREALENTEVQQLLREALGDNYTEQDAVKYMLGAVDDMENMRSTSRDAASARMGDTSVLEGKKGKQKRDLKGLTNLYGYDQTGKELNQRTGAEDYRALAELAKDFNLAEAMMTVEDYYRMLNPSDFSVAYGQAVPTVEQEIFDKAASDIQTFMGINVRDLKPEQVQGVLDEMSANSERTAEYLDYVQNLVKTEDAWKLEQKKQEEYDNKVRNIHAELELDPNYEFNSQRDMTETNPLYVAVMAEPGSDEQRQAITELGYDWWARVNGIMPLLGLNTEDSYGFDYMTDEQRKDFSALWRSSDYGGATQFLKDISWGVNKQKMQEEIQQTRDYAGDGFLKGALASAGSVGRNFMSEIEGMYNAARAAAGIDINEYDVGFMNTVKGQTARQTVGENIAESTKNLKLFGKNIPQMMYNGLMSAADSVLNATTLGGAASPLMGAAAFNSSFQQGLADGKDDKTAFIDAMVDWGIETGTEYFSIEALMDDTSSPLGYFFRNLLTEPAEEMTGFAAGEIYDNLVHGADSRVNNRIAELRTMGYSPADAKAQATREMLSDLFETGFSALIAGGVAGGGSAAQMAVTDRKTGSNLESHGDDAVEALLNLADKLDISDEVQQLVKNQRNVLKNRRSNSQTQEQTEEDQTETVPDEQEDVVAEEETPVEEPAEEELAPVDTVPAVEKQTEVGASEFKANEIGRIFRETMRVLDDSAKQTVQMVTSRYVAAELRKNGIDDPAITEAVLHIVSDDGKATPEQRQMVTASDGALDVVRRMTERTDNVRELHDRAARIAQKAAKKLKPGEKSEEEVFDEAARKMITEDAAQYTKNTDLIASAYETGQNPETFAEQFRKAFQYGEEGRNLDTIVKSSSFSGITERQVRRAYELGRGERVFRAQEAAKNRKGLVKTGNVDLSEVDKFVKGGGKLNETQRKGIRATSKLAKIVGFNVKYITNTADESGKITGKNGSWDKETRTLTLDINAGRLSNTDTNYAIMQTLGHELTHFIKDFADTGLFAEYQDFVFSHLSEKVSEGALDAKVNEYIARWAEQGQMLDHDGAIEEIVADASGDVLLKLTDADIQELTQKNPTLMQKVGQFIQRWVSDIKMMIADAYRGQTARNAIAEQMLDAADELGARWANLLKNAAENARKSDAVVTSQGAVVSPEVATIMESKDYSAPDNGLLSIRETKAWAKAHQEQYPDDKAFQQNLAMIENFDRSVAEDSVARYLVPHGRIPKTAKGPLRNNVEYVYTFDMDTKCERTYQFLAYRDAIQKKIGRQLEENEARNLIELMRAYGQMIPCTYCYVEGKRMKLAELYMNYLKKNSKSVMGEEHSVEKVFDMVEGARSIVAGYLDNRFNREENYMLDTTLATKDFEGYKDFELPVSEEEAAQEICDRYNITEKAAKRVISGFVAEWVYSRRMDVPMNLVNDEADFETDSIDERVLAFHDLASKAAQGGAKAKGIENYEPYVDQLKNISIEDKKYMVGMGGIRKHSSNDFQIQNVQDYMLFFMDLAADKRGGVDWTGHTYTKNLDYARIFAPTNDRINVSIAMYGDNKSGITPNTQEGVEWEELKKIRKKYKNVGAMSMVTNNDQLSFALNSDWIDMIIPFHASGMKRSLYYDVLAWTDYTSKQSERLYTKGQMIDKLREKGIKVSSSAKAADVQRMFMENFDVKTVYNEKTGKRVAPHFFPGETEQHGVKIPGHNNDAKRYFELCEQYGTNPRFFGVKVQDASGKTIDVTEHPAYLKLIKETARTDSPQEPIVAKFDMDYVNEAMKNFKGYASLSEDPYGIVDEFVREYAGKKRKVGNLTERAQQYKEIRSQMAAEEAEKRAKQRVEMLENINRDNPDETEQSEFADDTDVKFSVRVTDRETLEFLDGQDTVTTYKTMQVVDGKLYPPMAAVVAGKYEDASKLGAWEQATERPDLIKLDSKGKPQFNLNKGKGKGSLNAAYNPYMHSSNLVLNDQFSGAYDRPNLVTVECEVPVSELTSGYRAEYAKDAVGWHAWHTGTVAGALRRKTGIERQVLLSRWIKPVRIVPEAEVAQMYKELLEGTGIAVPDNVVPPALLAELKKAGVEIAISGRVPDSGEKLSLRQHDVVKSFDDNYYYGEGMRWVHEEYVLSKREHAALQQALKDITFRKYKTFTQTRDGQYIVPVERALVFTNGSYQYPKVSAVIRFNVADPAATLGEIEEGFKNGERRKDFDADEAWEIVEALLRDGQAEIFSRRVRAKDSWIEHRRSGESGGEAAEPFREWTGEYPVDDEDYQLRDPDQISDRELLANVMESAAMNEVELDQVKRYRGHIEKLNKYQAELADIAAAIEEGKAEGKPESAFAALRDKARRRQRMIDEEDSWLLKYEAAKPLQAVVQRERENLKRDYDERVEKRVATARNQEAKKREKLRERMDELRAEKNQKIDELRKEKTAKVKEVREEKNESFARQKYRKMIEDDVGRLRTWVTSPTNKDHVPQFLRKPIGDVIAALDFSSDRLLKGGDETNKDKRLGEALDALALALGRVKEQQASIDSGAQQFASYIDLPEGYQQEFAEMVQKIKLTLDLTKDRGELPINRMTSEQMHELSKCLRILTTSIRQMNRLLANSRFESAISAAGSTIDELGKMAARKDSFKATALLGKFLDWTNTTPIYAFKRFGKGGQAIFEGLMSGWDKLAFNSDALIRFADKAYSKKEVREWSREVRSVKLSSGETVRMTTAQLMSLYCLAKRAQAVGHLLGGGIRIADIDSKGKNIVQSSNYTLSEADLNAFSAELTERQREVADSLQHYMSTQGSKWGNEISMKRFGYEMFTEANYFPIESDSNNLVNVDEKQQENSMFKLLNMSATKGLVKGANNALVVRDIFDVFSAHMSDMAKYNALALPILDALKWLNYVEKVDNKDGSLNTRSVQKSLEAAYGKDARQYIVSFIKDLNGDREGGRNDGIINKAISNAKIASVAANLRVYLLQATSLPRAAYSINPKYLSVGLAKMAVNPKKGMDLANEKVGIAKWKSMGFYDTNISGNIREMVKHDQSVPDWIREKSMAPAGLMDGLTMGVIYYAAEAECKEKYKQTPVGGEAWDKLVNNRMRDIVYHTQVVDSTMTRSDAMRGKGIITLATSFMSEPTLTMNMIADSIYDMRLKHRGMEDLGHPTARLAKGMAVFTFTAVLAATAEALFDAIRDDDEYETFSEKYLTALVGDLTDEDTTFQKFTKILFSNIGSNLNMLNSIPFASDVMGLFEGFDNKPMYTAFVDSFKSGWDAYHRWLAGEGTMYSWIYSSLKGVSQVAGLPFSNATRDAVSVWNTFFADRYGKPRIQTYTDSKKQAASAVLDELIAGDTAKADFYRDRAAMHGIGEADIADSLAGLVNDAYVARKIDEKTAERLLTEEAGKRTSQAASMLNKSDYLLETGHKHSEMKDDYISGAISEADARKYLAEYNGMRRDEVESKISEWDYEKETGLTYSGMKQDFIDGILKDSEVIKYRTKYGGAAKDEVEETLGHWKYERDTGLAWSELEDDYADGVLSEERVRGYLAKYGGKDEEEVEEKISNYDYHIATGRSTAAPKYWRIAYAFDSGADYQSYIDEAFNTIMYGGEKRKTRNQARSQIASSLASYYKKEYLRVKGTPAGDAMLERILDLYEAIGYSRSYQRDYIAENWVEE